jgi:hypothetical protein
MKALLANFMWGALGLFWKRGHAAVFDPDRHRRIRMAHRQRWWKYHEKARTTGNVMAKERAIAWQIQFKFQTPPDVAIDRGDLGTVDLGDVD